MTLTLKAKLLVSLVRPKNEYMYKSSNLQVKILIDLGVGFKDSTGKHKVILTKLLEMMYSVYRSLTKIQVNNNHI